MDTYSTVRNVISEMLVIPNLNSPSLGTNSNEETIQPAASIPAGLGAWAQSVCYQDSLATGTSANLIKAIWGISTWTAPLLNGRRAFVLMLGCLLSRLVTSPAGRCASRVWAESRACPGPQSCWRLCHGFGCGKQTGCPAAWQQLWNGRLNLRTNQSWKWPTFCSSGQCRTQPVT